MSEAAKRAAERIHLSSRMGTGVLVRIIDEEFKPLRDALRFFIQQYGSGPCNEHTDTLTPTCEGWLCDIHAAVERAKEVVG